MKRQETISRLNVATERVRGIMTKAVANNTDVPRTKVSRARLCTVFTALLNAMLIAGCAGSNNNITAPLGLPTPTTPTTANTYTATQDAGLWSLTLDNTQDLFSYQAISYPASPATATTGNFTKTTNGFLALRASNSTLAGYAVEIPSRAALLGLNDSTSAPMFAVQQTTCFPIGGFVRFQLVGMPKVGSNGPGTTPTPGTIASIVTSTSADGSSWQFTDADYGYTGDGTSFTGTCNVANGQASVTIPGTSTYSTPTTFVVNESGLIFEDHSAAKQNASANSLVGFVQPLSPVSTSAVLAGTYAGFLFSPSAAPATQAIVFGPTPGATNSLTGGMFPNNDLSQLPNIDTIITLGTQDAANPGSYPNVTITQPDPTYECSIIGGLIGVDLYGFQTCTLTGAAVVGNTGSKYVILMNARTLNGTSGIYLFQQ